MTSLDISDDAEQDFVTFQTSCSQTGVQSPLGETMKVFKGIAGGFKGALEIAVTYLALHLTKLQHCSYLYSVKVFIHPSSALI